MQIEIITPDNTLFSGEAISVKFPGSGGRFETLNNHANIISSLDKGVIVVKTDQGNKEFQVEGGIVEFLKNKIIVLA